MQTHFLRLRQCIKTLPQRVDMLHYIAGVFRLGRENGCFLPVHFIAQPVFKQGGGVAEMIGNGVLGLLRGSLKALRML